MDTLITSSALRVLCFSSALALTSPVIAQTVTLPNQTLLSVSEPALNNLGEPISVAKSGQIQTADGKYPVGRADLQFTLNASSEMAVVVEGQAVNPGQTVIIPNWNFSSNNNGYELEIYSAQPGVTGQIQYSIQAPNAYVSTDPEAKVPEPSFILEFVAGTKVITEVDPYWGSELEATYTGFAYTRHESPRNFGTLNYFKYQNNKGEWITDNRMAFFPSAERTLTLNSDDQISIAKPTIDPYGGSISFGLFTKDKANYVHDSVWSGFSSVYNDRENTKFGYIIIRINGTIHMSEKFYGHSRFNSSWLGQAGPLGINHPSYQFNFKDGDVVNIELWGEETVDVEQRGLHFNELIVHTNSTPGHVIPNANAADTATQRAGILNYRAIDLKSWANGAIGAQNATDIGNNQLLVENNGWPIALINNSDQSVRHFDEYGIHAKNCEQGQINLYAYVRDHYNWVGGPQQKWRLYEEDWNGALETAVPAEGEATIALSSTNFWNNNLYTPDFSDLYSDFTAQPNVHLQVNEGLADISTIAKAENEYDYRISVMDTIKANEPRIKGFKVLRFIEKSETTSNHGTVNKGLVAVQSCKSGDLEYVSRTRSSVTQYGTLGLTMPFKDSLINNLLNNL